jgi:hypothetical protein
VAVFVPLAAFLAAGAASGAALGAGRQGALAFAASSALANLLLLLLVVGSQARVTTWPSYAMAFGLICGLGGLVGTLMAWGNWGAMAAGTLAFAVGGLIGGAWFGAVMSAGLVPLPYFRGHRVSEGLRFVGMLLPVAPSFLIAPILGSAVLARALAGKPRDRATPRSRRT